MDEGKISPSDAELIERCLRKDNAAWEQIVARFRRKVFHIAYKFTGKHDEAEDLTQEIFLKVFRSLDKFNRDADFSTWLSSVARNYCIDHYRASKREKEVLVEDLRGLRPGPRLLRQPPPGPRGRGPAAASSGAASSCSPTSCARRWCCGTCRGSATRRWRDRLAPPRGHGQEPDQPRARGAGAPAAARPAAGGGSRAAPGRAAGAEVR